MEVPSLHQPILEKKDLFAYIRAFGLRIDDSLLQEFQEQGVMLPAAERRGRGRAKGNRGLWTLQQRDLLRTLCMMREKQNIHSVAQRCNLIVWIWLYWGDEWGITLAQVQRVLKTWATYQQVSSLKTARQGARRVVNEVAYHRDGGKQQAMRDIADLFYKGTFTAQDLTEYLLPVFDAHKGPNGPHDIPVTPDAVSWAIALRLEAVKRLIQDPAFPDIQWQWARHFHLLGFGQYIQQQQGYAQEAAGGPVEHLFPIDTLETVLSTACVDVAAVLGIGLQDISSPTLPDHLRLDFWKAHVKGANVTSQRVISPILHLDGSRAQSLHIEETLTLLSKKEYDDRGSKP
ncbi:MAG: hypothetical protein NVSMB38_31950 [Ktedonobacteraceae bacterium]